jgi:Elongation factor Tu domain 2
MARKKETRGKKNAKRRKTPATKPRTGRKAKTVKKGPAKKASRALRKKVTPPAKVAVKRKPASPPARPAETPSPPAQAAPPEERIGVVTHYYSHLSVATVRLESGTLRVGDVIHIRGHTTDFSQPVESLEINHAPASEVGPGDDFGLKVIEHAREHDVVYKVGPR